MTEYDGWKIHPWFGAAPDAWIQKVVQIHFHREDGAPYWIHRARQLDFDPVEEIKTSRDLVKLGFMDEHALRDRPVSDFLPRALEGGMHERICVESSGTTGPPKTACFTERDFLGAFIASFRPVAEPLGFPIGKPWLFIGPTGPHAIGRAVRGLTRVMESPEPFTVDFDPRWARKLPEGSVAKARYMTHLIDQAEAILSREPVETLFATPPTLLALAERVAEKKRLHIKGIHFGGMPVDRELLKALRAAFPEAVFLSGYGNSLFGVALEMGGEDDREMDYFPSGPRHLIRVLKEDGNLVEDADYGETGRIVMSRLDESGFYPNVLERDFGTRIAPSREAEKQGIHLDGVRNPHPPKRTAVPRTGFY